jgi:hypothetical protein
MPGPAARALPAGPTAFCRQQAKESSCSRTPLEEKNGLASTGFAHQADPRLQNSVGKGVLRLN